MQETVRFDMQAPPKRPKWYLTILTWILSFPVVWLRRLKINKTNMKGLKPPYLLLCTHKSFADFMVATACVFPHRCNNVVAIDGFIGREGLLRNVGCICKRKFTNDVQLIFNMKKVIDNNDILALYPEARYSLIGTNACLPQSLGKLAKMFKVPVVMLHMRGNHIYSPVWNLNKRNVRLCADMEQIITKDELEKMNADEVNARINEAFVYDEYKWQRDNEIHVKYKGRAEGLEKVLYQCRECKTEFEMQTRGDQVWCEHCGSGWTMSTLGELTNNKSNEMLHIPDWYEFERENVRKQIEDGTYGFSAQAEVDSLPSAKGYVRLGTAQLTHNMDGFKLEGEFDGEKFLLEKTPLSMYSCHIEYEYEGNGDGIDLSTLDDTYYIYPQTKEWAATKVALATEELYEYTARQKKEAI
ncbi:MAG: hypothetical protein HN948_00190 [Clostridia bacterium]|nr:hypothetical protein [Clostridia bacterium]MBT7121406.1 hypothetical protein [Clostridia bacterium]